MEYIYEEAKEIPLVCNSDVLVAGGGPAGACAAIAAARIFLLNFITFSLNLIQKPS